MGDEQLPRRGWFGRHRVLRVSCGVIVVLLLTLLVAHLLPMPELEIGPDTTVIGGPLNADGTPDYLAALNSRMAAGVTPQNNAARLLLRVWGPEAIEVQGVTGQQTAAQVLQALAMSREDLSGNGRMIQWEEWLVERMARPEGFEDEAGSENDLPAEPYDAAAWYAMSLRGAVHLLQERGHLHPQLAAWIAANEPAFDLLTEAGRRERFYMPMVAESEPPVLLEVLLPNIASSTKTMMALEARARLRLHQGDWAGAWQDVLTLHRLGRQQMSEASLLSHVVGQIHLATASQLTTQLATQGQLPTDEARAVLAQLEQLSDIPSSVAAVDIGERYLTLDNILDYHRQQKMLLPTGSPNRADEIKLDWDVNQVLREANGWYDRFRDAFATADYAGRQQALRDVEDAFQDWNFERRSQTWKTRLYRLGGAITRQQFSDYVGMFPIATTMVGDTAGMAERKALTRTEFVLGVAALALAVYKGERGEYPERLEALVPDVLREVPQDAFSDKPLAYRRTEDGYVLYSVGPDLIDDGGKAIEPPSDEWDQPEKTGDIVVTVPAVKSKDK